jgi:DNA-binding NarL/FixJ family response regulator
VPQLSLLIIEDEIGLIERYRDYAQKVFETIFTAINCKEARAILKNEQIDCILADNKLPDGLGINLIKELKEQEHKNIPAIMITAYADKDLAIDSLNNGIFYFLEKPISKDKIIEILSKAYNEIKTENNHQHLEQNFQPNEKTISHLQETFSISARELEIIEMSLKFHRNTAIAEKLNIGIGTVKNHLHNIFEKMHISSKEELQTIIHELNSRM